MHLLCHETINSNDGGESNERNSLPLRCSKSNEAVRRSCNKPKIANLFRCCTNCKAPMSKRNFCDAVPYSAGIINLNNLFQVSKSKY